MYLRQGRLNIPSSRRALGKRWHGFKRRIKDYGYVGHIAYDNYSKPIGFIEFISSKGASLPIEDSETTAIITCIDVPKAPRGQGIGTSLLKTALKQLWKIGVRQVKTVVSRSPQWINNGIYRKHGFQLEKTFCKAGCAEPFDMFTLRLDGPQPKKSTRLLNISSRS